VDHLSNFGISSPLQKPEHSAEAFLATVLAIVLFVPPWEAPCYYTVGIAEIQ